MSVIQEDKGKRNTQKHLDPTSGWQAAHMAAGSQRPNKDVSGNNMELVHTEKF